eukprot:TRINITY_DN9375_c0_g1_i1.p1 TRINITY_DN9375_c0_g1~~TRINITY_DN9375_c0_g1_i1.p1  ORF type:complete len:334 (-),score=43.74 TRINITY_DN9375_c0_g1_i1:43-1044(-)
MLLNSLKKCHNFLNRTCTSSKVTQAPLLSLFFKRGAIIGRKDQTDLRLKTFKPTTPSLRHTKLLDYKKLGLHRGRPLIKLTKGKAKTGGRNNKGRITVRGRGGGHKRRNRFVDYKRDKTEVASVQRLEYDPNRSAFLALLRYVDGQSSYIIAPENLQPGDKVISGKKNVPVLPGNSMPIGQIPLNAEIHNIEVKAGDGGAFVRAAGSAAQVVSHEQRKGFTTIILPSKEHRFIPSHCQATIGTVSNPDHKNVNIGKAGRNRWKGWRPKVRGVAMNPVDHPHGGGEGKTSGGRPSCSPWGKLTKGPKTRRNKRTDKFIIQRRQVTIMQGKREKK